MRISPRQDLCNQAKTVNNKNKYPVYLLSQRPQPENSGVLCAHYSSVRKPYATNNFKLDDLYIKKHFYLYWWELKGGCFP